MFPKNYFAPVYFAPAYFPPVISTGPEPLPSKGDALSYGQSPFDYIGRDDEEFIELIPILLIALEE